ncbi:aminotransferase class I/II-fold pyridoxal phosphate-dependent enzyme [Halomonas piscis]|uniref:Aminotransferase class I/II-fold pyridoxal phosphate-dependent enzyme n=1 Tax=Halomonas piscis TaxID=3031727 RepID=A0ABY9YVK7_9GAMM|nr:aminotransferase class I/II-fold pyridoxal phosphate-dependent enzyme [Halomonas piscis]WNK18894.1 aminotransferase class I/II-fold pyridoxal phosphate-dependent enzyme [Halomonas piscis]
MTTLQQLNNFELDKVHRKINEEYNKFKAMGIQFNMARGKPAPEQLALAEQLLNLPGSGNYMASDGADCRNYGGERGLPEARELMSALVGAPPENTLVEGNSSLALMHDYLVFSLLRGNSDSLLPWSQEEKIRFLCPVPGYDYHFNMTEEYGIEMCPVSLDADGPDMDQVEELVAEDSSIKGMWCVPKYSNPTGTIYSDSVIKRLASMTTAAPDFRLFWDNAYAVHHLTEKRITIANILDACESAGHPNRALVFASTSKVTFPGGGIAAFASSTDNLQWFLEKIGKRSIVPDRINQLRHMALLPDEQALHALMDAHRQIIDPKFEAVHAAFDRWLTDPTVANWTRPKGGYFISLHTPKGCARRAVELAEKAGVTMTPAGAAFPYGNDPEDSHLRIAPTFLSMEEIEQAAEGIALSIRLAVSEKARTKNNLCYPITTPE